MVESHLKGGRQDIPDNLCDLEYGKSVTDGCIDWETTEKTLLEMHEAFKRCFTKPLIHLLRLKIKLSFLRAFYFG